MLRYFKSAPVIIASAALIAGCGSPTGNTNLTAVNTNVNATNSFANTGNINSNANTASTSVITSTVADQYQANVRLSLETLGQQNKASLPTLGATVARSGDDRTMEFALPNNEKIIYLDKGGVSYIVLPNRKQYAELTKDAVGFEVRRLMMPEQIVEQVKTIPGIRLVGEETMNGRQVTKYAYSAAANTQSQAGTVATESFLLIDKETGLPLRSETVSQSTSGGNVQGVSGLRIVTEMTDVKATPDPAIFNLPTDYEKIDPEAVKAQANLIFNALGVLIGQVVQQTQLAPSANASPMASPTATPMR